MQTRLALPPVLVSAALLLSLVACAKLVETPPDGALTSAPTPPEQARLLVYRPASTHLLGFVGDRDIALNDAPACGLSDQHYFVRLVPAGATSVGDGTSKLSFTAEAGRTYVVRVGFNKRRTSIAGWVPPVLGFGPDAVTADSGLYSFEIVEPKAAAYELAQTSPETGCR